MYARTASIFAEAGSVASGAVATVWGRQERHGRQDQGGEDERSGSGTEEIMAVIGRMLPDPRAHDHDGGPRGDEELEIPLVTE
jgi:hypothetical protein